MTIDSRRCQDLDRALSLEWLETNGRGGGVSGTGPRAEKRRPPALVLGGRGPPGGRGGLGGECFFLTSLASGRRVSVYFCGRALS